MRPLLLLATSVCLFLAACSDNANQTGSNAKDAPKTIVIKFPHVTAPATPKGQGADRLKQLVEERLGTRVRVDVFPAGQLMSDDDSLEALAFGEVQMIAVSLSKFDRFTKKFQVFDLPFLFKDIAAVERFQKGPEGQALLAALEDKGFKGLGFWHNGMKQFGAPRPLRLPEDAAKLKFRIQESDVLQAQILAVGASPQKMSFGEVYQALQTGAIDAQENTWSNIYSQKFFEVQDALTQSNHGYLGYFLAVNTDFWNGLPDDVRGPLKEIILQVNQEVNEMASQINAEARQTLIENEDKTITVLTDEEVRAWQIAMKPVWVQFEEEIGAATITAAASANVE
jgi:C4-dicarboxylate-binding protein DctP